MKSVKTRRCEHVHYLRCEMTPDTHNSTRIPLPMGTTTTTTMMQTRTRAEPRMAILTDGRRP